MIIIFFGKKKENNAVAKPDGPQADKDDDGGKIEFINLVEPLITIINRVDDYGTKLCALSIMALVNMCNYSEDIKDIFLMKNGISIIYGLLDSKNEDILLNNLRLIMTLISQKKSEIS